MLQRVSSCLDTRLKKNFRRNCNTSLLKSFASTNLLQTKEFYDTYKMLNSRFHITGNFIFVVSHLKITDDKVHKSFR
jgi:hypothetical protein